MQYFISDLHIGDKNIMTYEHRPFEKVERMREVIVQNWNETVASQDTVYLLGDIGDISILDALAGKIIIVCGNHDNANELKLNYPYIEVNTHPIMVDNMWLSHEPIGFMPPEIPYLNIHGHLHSFEYGLPGRKWEDGNRYFNVSVEKINYKPISADQIKKLIDYK